MMILAAIALATGWLTVLGFMAVDHLENRLIAHIAKLSRDVQPRSPIVPVDVDP